MKKNRLTGIEILKNPILQPLPVEYIVPRLKAKPVVVTDRNNFLDVAAEKKQSALNQEIQLVKWQLSAGHWGKMPARMWVYV